jgi:hypothetical protein
VNPSGQSVLLKSLFVRSQIADQTLQWSFRWDLNASVEPNKPSTTNLVELAKIQFRGREKEWFGLHQGNYAQHLKDADKQEIFRHRKYKEFVPTFLKKEGTEHRQVMEDIGNNVTSFPCVAEIEILFLQSHRKRKPSVECIGFIKHLERKIL